MNTKLLFMVFLFFLMAQQEVYSQLGFSHEVGIITGPVMFFSDYGVRGDFETNTKNVGIGIGLIHYLNFAYSASCDCYTRETYFNDHFKIRNEIDVHKTNFQHYGKWVSSDRTSVGADKLRAMSGSSTVFEIGSQLEYYPLSIRDFEAGAHKINPFISLGAHWVNFSPSAKSSRGPLNTEYTTIPKYFNAFQQEAGSTFAIVGSIGFRYKLTKMSDLMLDSRWHYYFDDYVDGLNPTFENNGRVEVPENKSNDWIYWLNVGYILYLN